MPRDQLLPTEREREPIVYLAAPYTHRFAKIEHERFDTTTAFAAKLMRAGLVVFSPLTHGHPMRPFGLPGDYPFWEKTCEAFVSAAAGLVVLTLDGWRESVGVRAELRLASLQAKPALILPPEFEPTAAWATKIKHALAASQPPAGP